MVYGPNSKFTFDDPTTFEDGSAATPADTASYNLYLGTASGNYSIVQNFPNVEPDEIVLSSITNPNFVDGDWFAVLTAQGLGGAESKPTAEIQFTYVSKVLSPPVNFQIV